jgi:hypothetical protein
MMTMDVQVQKISVISKEGNRTVNNVFAVPVYTFYPCLLSQKGVSKMQFFVTIPSLSLTVPG